MSRLPQAIGLTVGGLAGARLAACLPVRASHHQIRREVRALPDPPTDDVRVLGIDEFAFRRGMTYGTVLIEVATPETDRLAARPRHGHHRRVARRRPPAA